VAIKTVYAPNTNNAPGYDDRLDIVQQVQTRLAHRCSVVLVDLEDQFWNGADIWNFRIRQVTE
jgi:inactivated superfamily I helicase